MSGSPHKAVTQTSWSASGMWGKSRMSSRDWQWMSTKAPRIAGILHIVAWLIISFWEIASGLHFEGLYLNFPVREDRRDNVLYCHMDTRKWWKCKFYKGLPVLGPVDVLFSNEPIFTSPQVLTAHWRAPDPATIVTLFPNTTSYISLPQGEDQVLVSPQ